MKTMTQDVFVISDEIWSDIILKGYKHIPTQSIHEDARQRTVALYAPSKTFNLAGLVGSYHIIYNDWIRERVAKESSLSHYNQMNVLSMHALIGAYKPEGYEWVDELLKAGWDVGVAWQDGRMFHGACSIRMNLALPSSRVQEAFNRLDKYVFINS